MLRLLLVAVFCANAVSPTPNLYWSMDGINGSTLRPDIGDQVLWQGDLSTITGSASITGVKGDAINIEKSHVTIGGGSLPSSDNCIFSPANCNGGFTIAKWLNVREWQPSFLFASTFTTTVFPLTGPGFAVFPTNTNNYYSAHALLPNGTRWFSSIDRTLIPLNTWTHVTMTWSEGNGVKFYLNGTEVATYTESGTDTTTTSPTTSHLSFGADQMSIYMDELKIWFQELSPAEILRNFEDSPAG
uniref:LamG-like jellyroll fold domain-containing protein n=1 Tax=Ciona savignyi TaxID=51511 RepID=H2Z8A8_CIOSA